MPSWKALQRLARKKRIRRNVIGTAERPRMSVFRSLKQIYVQVIDDTTGRTVAFASSIEKSLQDAISEIRKNPPAPSEAKDEAEKGKKKKSKGKQEPVPSVNFLIARKVGETIADRCKEKNIRRVVFDRNGYKYHGRVKNLAEAARKTGLDF